MGDSVRFLEAFVEFTTRGIEAVQNATDDIQKKLASVRGDVPVEFSASGVAAVTTAVDRLDAKIRGASGLDPSRWTNRIDEAVKEVQEKIGKASGLGDIVGTLHEVLAKGVRGVGAQAGASLGAAISVGLAGVGAGVGAAIGGSIVNGVEHAIETVKEKIREFVADRRGTIALALSLNNRDFRDNPEALQGLEDSAPFALADKLREKVSHMFAGTTVSVEESHRALRRLIQSGMSPDQAIQQLEVFGGVAVRTGASIEQIGHAYESAYKRGRPTSRTIMGLPVEVVDELRRKMPELGDDIVSAANRGAVSMRDLNETLNVVASRGAPELAKMRLSVTGQWGQLWADVMESGSKAWAWLEKALAMDAWIGAIRELFDVLGELGSAMKDLFEGGLSSVIRGFADLAKDVLGGVRDLIRDVSDAVSYTAAGLSGMGEATRHPIDSSRYGTFGGRFVESDLEALKHESVGALQYHLGSPDSKEKGQLFRSGMHVSPGFKEKLPEIQKVLLERQDVPQSLKDFWMGLPEMGRAAYAGEGIRTPSASMSYQFVSLAGLAEKMQQEAAGGGDSQERAASALEDIRDNGVRIRDQSHPSAAPEQAVMR